MKLTTTKDIGSLVRQARKDSGLTQVQLAQRVGVSRDWIIRVEQGRATVELGLVLRTLKTLGVGLESAERKSSSHSDTGFDMNEVLNPSEGHS